MLSQIVKDVLEDVMPASTVADWLVDNCEGKPELATYDKKFRQAAKVTINDAIDVIAKFGTPLERRQIQRFRRLLKKARHFNGFPEQAFPLVKDMTFKGRAKLNKILRVTRKTKITVQKRLRFVVAQKLTDVRKKSSIANSYILDLGEMLGAQTP